MSTFAVSPGAYVREVDLSARIAAVSSTIGGIVVEATKGRTDRAVLCTSPGEYKEMFGIPHPRQALAGYSALTFLEQSDQLWVRRVAKGALHGGVIFSKIPSDNGGTISALRPMIVGETDPLNTLRMSDDMVFALVTIGPGDINYSALIEPNSVTEDGGFFINVFEGSSSQPVEQYLVSLEYRTDGFGKQMNLEQVINTRSTRIRAIVNHEFDGEISDDLVDYGPTVTPLYPDGVHLAAFGGGVDPQRIDGSANADVGIVSAAWEDFREPEMMDVNILINGGWTHPAVQLKMDDIAQYRKDCIAVLDAPSEYQEDISNLVKWRKGQLAGSLSSIETDAVGTNAASVMFDSSYSAIYAPDVMVFDENNAMQMYVPASGHVAAAYARTDSEARVWSSPAGMTRGRLNVLGVRKVYTQPHRNILNAAQVNTIRVIKGHGIKIWGDLTTQVRASALSDVPVRRLLCMLEKSISIAMLYNVFDPNNNILRTHLRTMCNDMLLPIKTAGGLYHYLTVCDERNNSDDDVDAGVLHLDVYLKPTRNAKVIILSVVITKTGASFEELISSNVAHMN